MLNKWMFALFVLMVGCSAPASPTPFAPTQPIPTHTVAPAPTATLTVAEHALQMFPLKRGAQWVYQEIAYDTIPNDVLPERTNRQITGTLWITDTVTDTQTRAGKYAAQVVRERTLISTTLDLARLGEYGDDYFANNAPATKWYIFADDKIYWQWDILDWDAVMSSTLELQLPLVEGAQWYPDAEQRAEFTVEQGIPGLRLVEAAPRVRVPAGEFADCFVLHDFYNTGGILTEFCPGVGIVSEGFDHAGTPFGTHSALLKFTAGQ